MQARTLLILFFLLAISPSGYTHSKITTGAEHIAQYLSLIQGKRVGMVVNHTSIVGIEQTHLLDTLLKLDIKIVKVFAPEHGFRGNTDAGETVKDGKDLRTGIPIISLYGNNKKPTAGQLKDIDIILFDIRITDVYLDFSIFQHNRHDAFIIHIKCHHLYGIDFAFHGEQTVRYLSRIQFHPFTITQGLKIQHFSIQTVY